MDEPGKKPHPKRKLILWSITLFFTVIAIGWVFYYLMWGRFDEYTDDAYVSGNLIYVTPQVEGIITKIYADDTLCVQKGEVLIELDPVDLKIALEKSKASLAESVRKVAALFAEGSQKKASIAIAKAKFIKDAEDFERRSLLVDSGSVSKEDLSHAEAALSSSYFSLIVNEQSYFSVLAQVENTEIPTHPFVRTAAAEMKEAWVRLRRAVIKAPAAGLVAQRSAQTGERVNPAQPLLAVVPLDQIWVDANFKEDQLGKMRIGQKAKIRTDIYGRSVVYTGHVVGIGAGTGSVFSLLPPQNATGNWIKIVQRIPVRIALDEEEITNHPLRIGLSMKVHVDIRKPEEDCAEGIARGVPIYATDIFGDEEDGVQEEIDAVIQNNLPTFTSKLQSEANS